MAKETFLINPPRRKRKAVSRKTTKAATRSRRKSKVHRPVLYETGPNTWSRSPVSRSRAAGIKINPFGEEVMIVGANPRRRKRRTSVKRRRRRISLNAPRRVRRRRRSYRRNPVISRRRRRSYRRNPAVSVGGISLMNPMSLIMPAAIGLGAKMAAERLPAMVNMTTPLPKFGVQMAVAFGGGMLLSKPLGKQNAQVWTLFAAVTALSDLLQTYVFRGMAGLSGHFDYPQIASAPYAPQIASSNGMSAYPEELGAFPYGESVVY